MRNFTARYLEDVGIGDGVFQDVVPGELARPNLSTLVVDELPGWLETPNLDTPVSEAVLHGRMTATMLVPFRSDNAGQHRQAIDRPPLSDRGFHQRQPSWLRLAVDTPFLIEDRVLKFTVHREGTGTGSASAGWQVVAILQDGTEVVLTGVAHIAEGEDSVEVTVDFDAISLPTTNYASASLYWSWGIPMHSSQSSRGGTAIEVSEDAPFYTRSLVLEPWLYWGDHSTRLDLSGNGRMSSSLSYLGVVPGPPGTYATHAVQGLRKGIYFNSESPSPNFPAPLAEWSVSAVFRVNDESTAYHKWIFSSGNMGIVVPHNEHSLAITWRNYGPFRVFAGLVGEGWHHIVVTFDGSNYDAYLDGSHVPIWDQPPPEVASGSSFAVYSLGGGQAYIEHSDFAVWDRVLTQSDVQYIYAGLG